MRLRVQYAAGNGISDNKGYDYIVFTDIDY